MDLELVPGCADTTVTLSAHNIAHFFVLASRTRKITSTPPHENWGRSKNLYEHILGNIVCILDSTLGAGGAQAEVCSRAGTFGLIVRWAKGKPNVKGMTCRCVTDSKATMDDKPGG
jgi:hypothetical protein